MELNPEGVNDKNSQSTEVCVSVIERETRKALKGEEAPSSAELSSWLEAHPGWEVKEDDDDDESGDEDSEKDKIVMLQVQLQLNHRLLSFKIKTQKLFLLNMQRRLCNRLSPKLKMMNAKIKWDNKLIMGEKRR
ncbi:unnamed protein product [Orchesella dallaii]|uniref:BRK domain-containing protein n=1 Tax=Orchesella dallaii TaxID=48710 RepID=A0ABP1PQF2_9HEXA